MVALAAQIKSKAELAKLIDDLSQENDTVIVITVKDENDKDSYALGVNGQPSNILLALERTIINVVNRVPGTDDKTKNRLIKAIGKHLKLLQKEE